MFEVWWDL